MENSRRGPIDRILAIDFGTVRIGLAVSDGLGLTAQALETIERTTKAADLHRIRQAVAEYSPSRILVGHPIGHSGAETEMSRRAIRFAEELRSALDVPVEMWDERLTTREADRFLAAAGLSRAQRRQSRDRVAAQILLQSYLDRHAYEREHVEPRAQS